MRVGILNGINFNSVEISTVPSYSATPIFIKALTLWRFDNMISGYLVYFHGACAESAI